MDCVEECDDIVEANTSKRLMFLRMSCGWKTHNVCSS